MASFSVAWILLSLAVRFSTAIPSITFPLNSQVPPVARIGQPFSFVFSESTFTSPFAITYTLANPPAWLSIDSEARRLFGTPQDADVPTGDIVGVPVTLVATDETGSATLDATLVVSRESSPSVQIPIDEQIPQFGVFSSPSSILAPPDAPFSFQVYSDTFSNPSDSILNYYAVTLDHTPLPAWVSFDPSTLSFSGRTPPFESLIQPPQAFSLQLVASDVEGFSAASLDFTIVVGSHMITSAQTVIVLNATVGEPIQYDTLRNQVNVDGQPATPENAVIQSTTNIPLWITLDSTSWQIAGTPPENTETTNFTVTLADRFSDALNITFVLEITGQTHSLLSRDIPIIDITPGEDFSFELGPYLTSPEDTDILVQEHIPSWVRSSQETKVISGSVPITAIDPVIIINIDLRSRSSAITDSVQLTFEVLNALPSSTVVVQPSATSTNSIKAPVSNDSGNSPPRVNTILLAILLPIFLVVALAIILFIWWYRRRREEPAPKRIPRDISGPLPGSFVVTAHGIPGSESYQDIDGKSSRSASANNDTAAAPAHAVDYEKKGPLESRSVYQTAEGELMVRPLSSVRLIPSTERLRAAASNLIAKGRAASQGSRSALSSRRGRPRRANSTLSSISETTSHLLDASFGMIGERRFLELPKHNGSASSFRGDIEINIPALRDPSAPPESAYTGDESNWTDAPYAPSSMGSSHGDGRHSASDISHQGPYSLPLRPASRQGNYPRAPSRNFAWPWAKRPSMRGPRASLFNRNGGGKKQQTSQQASLRSSASIDTFAHRREVRSRGKSPAKSSNRDRDSNTTTGTSFSGISFPQTPILPELPRLPSLIRPVTRRGERYRPDDDDDDDGISIRSSMITGTIRTTTTDVGNRGSTHGRKRAATLEERESIYTANDPVSAGKKKSFVPEHSEWAVTKGHSHDSLGIIYSDLVKRAPFHPSLSALWSSAASTPSKKGKDPTGDDSSAILPRNWASMGNSSPVIKDWGFSSNVGDDDEDVELGRGVSITAEKQRSAAMVSMGSPVKSPGLPSLSGRPGLIGGGLRLVEPSSSIRGPPSEADVMSINTVDYWKERVGAVGKATSATGLGSSVMSIPRDMTPAHDESHNTNYWNKIGGKVFSRSDGMSWTADLGRSSNNARVKKHSRGKGRGGGGSISRVSIISEGKDRDAAAAASLASASKSSVGGSHYYI
ncbi:hypothetical protein QBC37DRAFT_399353 [Rhypophila decipiens]|uniref:Dystroglycan-type cadherin-like domain-containing protein n=1 Tax=Rhypophila decipiens TaxID=261697 RepID=A0AAN6Y9V7_9PEZI|nr:hypothetical protein QBC37DRAFT_399353 [Rhypophila decipiens]